MATILTVGVTVGVTAACGTDSSSNPSATSSVAATTPGHVEQFTPAMMRVMSPPRWFTGSDARRHIVYELELTNGFPVPVTVTRVEAVDRDTGRTLATLAGADVAPSMSLLASGTVPTPTIGPSTVGVLWMDVSLGEADQIPAHIEHRLTVSVPPGLPVPESITYSGGSADVDRRDPTVIGPPLAGPGWIAVGSCCDGPHRRSAQPIDDELWLAQRFAIDFNRLGPGSRLAEGDPSVNASWFTYDQPVLAVADAEVVAAGSDYADQVPDAPRPVGIDEADGNHVILKLSDGVYAFYAHLKPGSVGVRVGQRVTPGQEIGRTGNSGSSSGPHLHFQLMDRPSALVADGLPYEIRSFVLAGTSPPIAQLMSADPGDPVAIDRAEAGPRTDQLPLGGTVVDFPTR